MIITGKIILIQVSQCFVKYEASSIKHYKEGKHGNMKKKCACNYILINKYINKKCPSMNVRENFKRYTWEKV